MPKPFLIDSSKFAQLKTKVAAFAKSIKAQGPLAITIASMSVVAIITTFTLVFSYRQTPLNPEAPSEIHQQTSHKLVAPVHRNLQITIRRTTLPPTSLLLSSTSNPPSTLG